MRIRVDPEKCQGHARCIGIAPELFEVDDYGLSSVTQDPVPKDLEDGPARHRQLPRVHDRDRLGVSGLASVVA